MKKTLVLLLVVSGFVSALYPQSHQVQITNLSFPSSVNIFDLYEVYFKTSAVFSNPYDPDVVDIYAIFSGPNNTCDTVRAFYYEGYNLQYQNGYEVATHVPLSNGWKIRYTPRYAGSWSFCIRINGVTPAEPGLGTDRVTYHYFTCASVNNAEGFISKANSRYLKRDVIVDGQRQYRSFFPVGPNIGWYYCKDGDWDKPKGIYQYKTRIDSLYNNANYLRLWICRYQYLSLYGPEYTQLENGQPKVYFDSIINQKDSAELDSIVYYAAQHGIAVMPCFFTFGDFVDLANTQGNPSESVWENNPFNTILGLQNPCDFFSDPEAKRITKNLIRYIIARWGYATNIMAWELWNEVGNTFIMNPGTATEKNAVAWHHEMSNYIHKIDPFHHCITTSTSSLNTIFYNLGFSDMDFVQHHFYDNIDYARSDYQLSYKAFNMAQDAHNDYSSKPLFFGEFDFGQGDFAHSTKDPWGIELHNHLWSSLFSSALGSTSCWWWGYLNTRGLYHIFRPIYNFCNNMPILSNQFSTYTTGIELNHSLIFPNSIGTYYMKNATEDTIYGWCQDTAFFYQSLRWLTDSVRPVSYGSIAAWTFVDDAVFNPSGYVYTLNPAKKPQPSSNNNQIVLLISSSVPVGTQYRVKWYNTETGNIYPTETTIVTVQPLSNINYILINVPVSIRNINQHIITNTFGDAVFEITRIN